MSRTHGRKGPQRAWQPGDSYTVDKRSVSLRGVASKRSARRAGDNYFALRLRLGEAWSVAV